jgi:hypothetical protein
MTSTQITDYEGSLSKGTMGSQLMEGLGLARSDSMEIKNDPRFFSDNVINYRLGAFGSLAVVSALMVDCAMSDIMDMDKNMNLSRWVGAIQFISFFMLIVVFYFNIIATYVGVAQPYHTIRLLTSGPTGFEAAASYYLNKNIVTWRHFAIKYMLISLPLYITQMGLRLVVKFDRGNKDDSAPDGEWAPQYSRMQGIFFGSVLIFMGIILYCVHHMHFEVFRERHRMMVEPNHKMSAFVAGLSNPHMTTKANPSWRSNLDV